MNYKLYCLGLWCWGLPHVILSWRSTKSLGSPRKPNGLKQKCLLGPIVCWAPRLCQILRSLVFRGSHISFWSRTKVWIKLHTSKNARGRRECWPYIFLWCEHTLAINSARSAWMLATFDEQIRRRKTKVHPKFIEHDLWTKTCSLNRRTCLNRFWYDFNQNRFTWLGHINHTTRRKSQIPHFVSSSFPKKITSIR